MHRRIDGQLVRGDLRQRRFVPLAVIVHPDVNDHGAVGQHAGVGQLVARDHAELALDEFRRAVTALLGIERKADADGAAVRLAGRLAPAHAGRSIMSRAVSSALT